jgi:hypothetical protein
MMQEYQERVIAERSELVEKVEKLKLFLADKLFDTLAPAEQWRLTRQLVYMQSYLAVLEERIATF